MSNLHYIIRHRPVKHQRRRLNSMTYQSTKKQIRLIKSADTDQN